MKKLKVITEIEGSRWWKDFSCALIARISILKMSNLLKKSRDSMEIPSKF